MVHHQHSSEHPEDDELSKPEESEHGGVDQQRRRKLCHHASLSHLKSAAGYDHHTLPVTYHRHHHSHHCKRSASSGGGGSTSRKQCPGTHQNHHPHYHHRRHRVHHHGTNTRQNRSHTDVSNTSVNTCHEPCPDQEVREILIQRPCCSSSKTEIVQYFIEDLYGPPSGRISCCTSSDYCYHTDSTSLYGSQSSLSRNGSVKSGSATIRRKRVSHRRKVPHTSISLCKLNRSIPNSLDDGSLTSIFDKRRDICGSGGKMVVSPSKITVERSIKDMKVGGLVKEKPSCGCSASPIRWSFLAGRGRKPPPDDFGAGAAALTSQDESDSMRKYTDYSGESHESQSSTLSRTESNTVVFHQDGEATNNCCNNYLQYNAYLDQDLQITSADICDYLSSTKDKKGEVLNNSTNYPFQPTNALEFQYRKNFHFPNNESAELFFQNQRRHSSKETNLNQNTAELIALSSSSNNINIIFNSYADTNVGEVKFINTTRESSNNVEGGQQTSFIHQHSYPSYEYNNMSTNSLFDKPLGIDEIPSSSSNPRTSTATTPENFFETTSSSQNLLYCRYAPYRECQSSAPNFTNNPISTSFINNEASLNRVLLQQPSLPPDQQQYEYQPINEQRVHQHFQQYHHHHRHCQVSSRRWQHVTENLKIGNALKLVRKRARKCAQYLRKK